MHSLFFHLSPLLFLVLLSLSNMQLKLIRSSFKGYDLSYCDAKLTWPKRKHYSFTCHPMQWLN